MMLNHLARVPEEFNQPRPRLPVFHLLRVDFVFAGDWKRVDRLARDRRHPCLAVSTLEPHARTLADVVILAEVLVLSDLGDDLTVRVYDFAIEAHFDDTRKPTGSRLPTGATGVVSGTSISS